MSGEHTPHLNFLEVAMAKRRTERLENGYKNPPKKRSYEHYRLEYNGLDKARKKTLLTVSMFLLLCATVALGVAHFLK